MINKLSRQVSRNPLKQAGLTLIELGIAIAISATIIVVVIMAVSQTNLTSKAMQANQMINTLISAAQSYGYPTSGETSAAYLGDLNTAGLIPIAIPLDPWSGVISVTLANNGLKILLPGATQAGTCALLIKDWTGNATDLSTSTTCSTDGFFVQMGGSPAS